MHRLVTRLATLICLAGVTLASSQAHADFVGSFGFNTNLPVASPANNLTTATSFTFFNFTTNGIASGGFSGIPILTPFTAVSSTPTTPITLSLSSATGFNFTNATFGTFTQTAQATLVSPLTPGAIVTAEAFRILGTFTGAPGQTSPLISSVTISFTQNGGPNTAISASGTVNVPAVSVPEPASVVMLGLGLVGLGGVTLRRRMTR